MKHLSTTPRSSSLALLGVRIFNSDQREEAIRHLDSGEPAVILPSGLSAASHTLLKLLSGEKGYDDPFPPLLATRNPRVLREYYPSVPEMSQMMDIAEEFADPLFLMIASNSPFSADCMSREPILCPVLIDLSTMEIVVSRYVYGVPVLLSIVQWVVGEEKIGDYKEYLMEVGSRIYANAVLRELEDRKKSTDKKQYIDTFYRLRRFTKSSEYDDSGDVDVVEQKVHSTSHSVSRVCKRKPTRRKHVESSPDKVPLDDMYDRLMNLTSRLLRMEEIEEQRISTSSSPVLELVATTDSISLYARGSKTIPIHLHRIWRDRHTIDVHAIFRSLNATKSSKKIDELLERDNNAFLKLLLGKDKFLVYRRFPGDVLPVAHIYAAPIPIGKKDRDVHDPPPHIYSTCLLDLAYITSVERSKGNADEGSDKMTIKEEALVPTVSPLGYSFLIRPELYFASCSSQGQVCYTFRYERGQDMPKYLVLGEHNEYSASQIDVLENVTSVPLDEIEDIMERYMSPSSLRD